MLLEFISAKDALAMAEDAKKHYREEERSALLRYVNAEIKDACKVGDLSTTVEVEEEDLNFLISFLKEKGYNTEEVPDENRGLLEPMKIEICWD